MDEEKVKVRILPLKGIGGVGNAGDVVTMSAADAEMYARDGFVEYVADPAPSALRASTTRFARVPSPPNSESANLEESHEIMKPQAKRMKRK